MNKNSFYMYSFSIAHMKLCILEFNSVFVVEQAIVIKLIRQHRRKIGEKIIGVFFSRHHLTFRGKLLLRQNIRAAICGIFKLGTSFLLMIVRSNRISFLSSCDVLKIGEAFGTYTYIFLRHLSRIIENYRIDRITI